MNDFESQWNNISSMGHSAGRLRVYPDHLLDFFISFSLNGHRELIIEAKGINTDLGELPVFQNFDLVTNQNEKGVSIGLALIDSELVKSFAVMCYDIAERSKQANSIEAALIISVECLRNWASLLKFRGKSGLTRNEVIGLWGEIAVLEALIESNINNTLTLLQGWRGPNGDQRDIGYNNVRIEVKTQLSTQSISLKISSLEQLDDGDQVLKVVLNRISPSESGISLSCLIERVSEKLALNRQAHSEFERKVMLAEFDSKLTYCNELFGLDERLIYEVLEAFPKLVPSNVPHGIKNVSYEISGNSITEYQITWNKLLENLNGQS